jgi:hypothetical protein
MWGKRIRTERIIPISMGLLLLALLAAGARPRMYQEPRDYGTKRMFPDKPQVLRMKQQGSPLTINDISIDNSKDALMPTIRCNVKNNAREQIAAYAVKHEAVFGQRAGTVSGSVAFNPVDRDQGMRPGDTRQVEIGGLNYGEMPDTISLSVDFVEFVSGSRWGPDTLKTSESIDGVRAGAQAEREVLLNLLMTQGTDALMRSLDSVNAEADQSLPRSSQWLDGFRHGVGWIRERVRSKSPKRSEIETELRRSGFFIDGGGKPR